MASAIVGRRPVRLATDDASRKALRAVQRPAATMGDTIHLDPTAVSGARTAEVLAHELVHVAHDSPEPRFFDDVIDSPEERRAVEMGRLMAQAPAPAAASLVSHPKRRETPTGGDVRRTIRRSPANGSPPTDTVDAAALAARLTGGAPSTIRRSPTSPVPPTAPSFSGAAPRSASGATSSPGSDQSTVIRRLSGAESSESSVDLEADTDEESVVSDVDMDKIFDEVVERLEDRLLREIDRRGGQRWRGF